MSLSSLGCSTQSNTVVIQVTTEDGSRLTFIFGHCYRFGKYNPEFCLKRDTYLETENNAPHESKDCTGLSIHDVESIDTHQFYLKKDCKLGFSCILCSTVSVYKSTIFNQHDCLLQAPLSYLICLVAITNFQYFNMPYRHFNGRIDT